MEHFSFVAVAFCYGYYRLGHAVEAKDNVATREPFVVAPYGVFTEGAAAKKTAKMEDFATPQRGDWRG